MVEIVNLSYKIDKLLEAQRGLEELDTNAQLAGVSTDTQLKINCLHNQLGEEYKKLVIMAFQEGLLEWTDHASGT